MILVSLIEVPAYLFLIVTQDAAGRLVSTIYHAIIANGIVLIIQLEYSLI